MKTNIAGITQNMLQARAELKAESAGSTKEQKLSVSFFEMMGQSTASYNAGAKSDSDELVYRVDAADSSSTQNAYDVYANPAKGVAVKEDVPPKEVLSEASEELTEYEKEVRAALKGQFGITDEEIDQILESLGLTILDLGNISDLTAFVQELTGQDIGALFLSEAFQDVKSMVTEAAETLCTELGISKEELDALAETLKSQMQPEGETPVLPEGEAPDTVISEMPGQAETLQEGAQTQEIVKEISPETEGIPQKGQEAVSVTVQESEAPPEEAVMEESGDATQKEGTTVQKSGGSELGQAADGSTGQNSGEPEENLLEQAKNTAPDTPNAAVHAAVPEAQAVKAEQFAIPQETAVPYASQIDTMQIIEQIAKQVRVTVSAAATSMEMQLNPENLGKIYLNITEKEGAVRAQLAAQNQTVKEALETQVAELRQSLSQQGIKVDAIEVTVASHEFEQNLEENARQEEQMREQMQQSGKQTRRSLNLSELDELSGLMTEEEQLVAQIMRDNGNQVDLTA